MRKITLTNDFKQNRTSFEDARTSFIKFCKLKNLAKPSLDYYDGHSTLEMTRHYVNLYGADLSRDIERLNPLDNTKKAT